MKSSGNACLLVSIITLTSIGCSGKRDLDLHRLADAAAPFVKYDLSLRQELINDAPIGPGDPQPSEHCPMEPGNWFAGSGRSTATSNVFGDLTEVEVYCINTDLSQLSGGIATWTDADGDSIEMTFGAAPLKGFVYEAAPSAPLIGFAQFVGGSGKWSGLTGSAFLVGRQNGDGTSTLQYSGTVYLPADQNTNE